MMARRISVRNGQSVRLLIYLIKGVLRPEELRAGERERNVIFLPSQSRQRNKERRFGARGNK